MSYYSIVFISCSKAEVDPQLWRVPQHGIKFCNLLEMSPPLALQYFHLVDYSISSRNKGDVFTRTSKHLRRDIQYLQKKYIIPFFTQGCNFCMIFVDQTYTYAKDEVLKKNQLNRKAQLCLLKC
jgi:hypothetical protein